MKDILNYDNSIFCLSSDRLENERALISTLSKITFIHATNLARKGEYKLAEEVILPALKKNKSVRLMDLYAKILTQQNRNEEACVLWEKALTMKPDNKRIKQALNKCKKRCNAEVPQDNK